LPVLWPNTFVGNFADKAPDKAPDKEGKGFSRTEPDGSSPKEGIEQKIAKFAKNEDRVPLRYLCVLLFKFPFRFLSKPPRGKPEAARSL